MSEKRASSDLMDELHALQAATLMSEVKKYTEHRDVDGNLDPLPVPPALLSQINKFLKDNGIDSPGRAKKLDDAVGRGLPDLDDVETEHMARN
jgi:hypothetical protein